MVKHSSRRQQWHDGGSHTGTRCRPNASVKEVNHAIHVGRMMGIRALYARDTTDAFATRYNKSGGRTATDAPSRDRSGMETEYATDYVCSSPRVCDVHPAIIERSPER